MTYLKEELFSEDSIIDPNWVIRYLLNHMSPGRVSSKEVMRIVKKMLTHLDDVKITFRKAPTVKGCFAVSGVYDTETKTSIHLEIFNEAYEKKFQLNESYYNRFIYDVADTLCHESIHRYQHKVRLYEDYFEGFSVDEQEKYYSDPDELFAYSVNIAHNLYRTYGDDLLLHLSDYKSIIDMDPYFSDYCLIFNNKKILNKLLKMIYLNVVAIQQGSVCHRTNLNA